ncbi:MAG: NUDIX hydrolase [Candidatus Portnoybacteria bacterium]|nr:NUDIX hydrolase [Candidatus Portnoybacteria bacterium]
MTEKKKFYISVKAAFARDERVLLLRNVRSKWQGKVFWDFPGGRIREGEAIEKALRRSVLEETDIRDFTMGRLIGIYLLKTDVEYKTGLMLLIYQCETKEENIALSDEHDKYGWFTKKEIETLDRGNGYYVESALQVLGRKS